MRTPAQICTVSAAIILGLGAATPETAPRTDYLTFAQGAVPIAIGGEGAKLGANYEHAVRVIDGSEAGFVVVSKGTANTATEFTYELPAPTTFDRFAVPQVRETPSPLQTFTRTVEVYGSAAGAVGGYQLLASGTLQTHKKKGEVTELSLKQQVPVRWVKVKLVGGIDLPEGAGALEFSEIVGNGRQEPAAFSDRFHGVWKQGANLMQLKQEGAVVSGCYDKAGDLTGTVSGNVLRATGLNRSDKTKSAFILSVAPDGQLRGVRSANGAPFRLYVLASAPGAKAACQTPPTRIGCGSIVHGINFDYDSAVIRKESEPVLAALYDGLKADNSASIGIEGHTSSEGATDYNQSLSERRAQAVVEDLKRRGIAPARVKASGAGEVRPIASNADENGRALNRRVEVHCL